MRAFSIVLSCILLSGCVTTYAQVQQQRAADREIDRARLSDIKAKVQANKKAYVDNHPNLSDELKRAILEEGLVIGMNAEQVRMSIGTPNDITKTTTVSGTLEMWRYGDTYRMSSWKSLTFRDGLLTSWTE